MALGNQIKKYRGKLGWTLEKLTEVSKVDDGTISALENRDSVRSKYALAIAKAFGLTVEELCDELVDYDVVARIAVPAPNTANALIAAEPALPWRWPFKTIKPWQYDLLEDSDRDAIEIHIHLYVTTRAGPTKQPAPANYIAKVHTT